MIFKRKKDNATEHKNPLEKLKGILGKDDLKKLFDLIDEEKSIPPKIAVVGKSGVGKTTTVNNLFNSNWKTSHSVAGTKQAQVKEFELTGGGSLMIYDMPGLGEDIDQDIEYEKIYKEIIPSVDVVLWIIQANTRDLAEDQRILLKIIKENSENLDKKLVIGLNQVDKIGPGEWNIKLNYPSEEQEKSIEEKCNDIITKLSTVVDISKDKITYYSAEKRYRLSDILVLMIKGAGNLGWKLPLQPKDPFDLADPEVKEFVNEIRKK